jgi:hypothetical protein
MYYDGELRDRGFLGLINTGNTSRNTRLSASSIFLTPGRVFMPVGTFYMELPTDI